MDKAALKEILQRYEEGRANPEEIQLVEAWYQSYYKDQLDTEIPPEIATWEQEDWEAIQAKIHPKRSWAWTAVAASILFLAFASLLVYYIQDNKPEPLQVALDLEPGSNKAQLKTASGEWIQLSDAHSGIIMEDHQVRYDNGIPLMQDVELINSGALELSTPRGGTYHITLSDGTQVWLNSATKLRYPARFSPQERRVFLEGEAYFEVAENSNSPFIVESQEQEIKVLGTHFNLNTFKDEGVIKTTLIEGKIQITHNDTRQQKIVLPHQQALVGKQLFTVQEVSVAQFIGWKDQVFIYNETSLRAILLELSRWYNFKIETDAIPEVLLSGEIMRNVPLSEVLHLLERAGKVKLEVVADGAERRLMIKD